LEQPLNFRLDARARDGTRTHDSHLGKVALYQLSYTRKHAIPYWETLYATILANPFATVK
jgi:hypothetical protein